jgi:hypothetical protein
MGEPSIPPRPDVKPSPQWLTLAALFLTLAGRGNGVPPIGRILVMAGRSRVFAAARVAIGLVGRSDIRWGDIVSACSKAAVRGVAPPLSVRAPTRHHHSGGSNCRSLRVGVSWVHRCGQRSLRWTERRSSPAHDSVLFLPTLTAHGVHSWLLGCSAA